jgi:hypothetical protein
VADSEFKKLLLESDIDGFFDFLEEKLEEFDISDSERVELKNIIVERNREL